MGVKYLIIQIRCQFSWIRMLNILHIRSLSRTESLLSEPRVCLILIKICLTNRVILLILSVFMQIYEQRKLAASWT